VGFNHARFVVVEVKLSKVISESLRFSPAIHYSTSLVYNRPTEICNSSDQAAHYHILSLYIVTCRPLAWSALQSLYWQRTCV
jgi:hypothetical protein